MTTARIKDIMTLNPATVRPEQTVKTAAQMMRDVDCGVLPVGVPGKVLGMLTDRDIVVRLVAEGGDAAETAVENIMTGKVYMCEENDSLATAAEAMRKHDISRLIVTDGKKPTGIVTLACLLRATGKEKDSDKVLHELLYAKHHGKPKRKEACCA